MYTKNSLWNCFEKSIFNVKMIKILPLIAHSAYFRTFPTCSFPCICQGLAMQRRWLHGGVCVAASVPQEGTQQELYTKIFSGRGPCLYWYWSNANNCPDHMTALLSLEITLPSTRERELQEIGEKLLQIYDEKYIRLLSRCTALSVNKRLLSGFCISENHDL